MKKKGSNSLNLTSDLRQSGCDDGPEPLRSFLQLLRIGCLVMEKTECKQCGPLSEGQRSAPRQWTSVSYCVNLSVLLINPRHES